jgi:hypothetical protein
MKKSVIATAAGAALAGLWIGLAATAAAAPSGPDPQIPGPGSHQTGGGAHDWFGKPSQNAYGSYQNDNPRQSGSRR